MHPIQRHFLKTENLSAPKIADGALAVEKCRVVARDGLAEHTLVVRSADPLVVKEVQVTTYHVLWELVHVFAEQPGVLS